LALTCELVSFRGETSINFKFAWGVFTNQEGQGPLARSHITEPYIRTPRVQHKIEGVALQQHQCIVMFYNAFDM
jgi:hypothetical protein